MGNAHTTTGSHFLDDDDLWVQHESIVKCTECFPNNIKAMKPCLPSCVFTENGRGSPPVIEYTFKGKSPVADSETPYFIVSYGPPASGKSTIIEVLHRLIPSTTQTLKLDNIVPVNVDDIFQKGPLGQRFKAQMDAIKSEQGTTPLHTQRLYMYYRWVADQISDIILNTALASRFSVLWESTGADINWTQRELARINTMKYKTLLVMPLVSENELLARLARRAAIEKQEPAPVKEMSEKISSALDNILCFMRKCACPAWVTENLRVSADSCSPHRIVIYNNEVKPGKEELLYDSDSPMMYRDRMRYAINLLVKNQKFIDYFNRI